MSIRELPIPKAPPRPPWHRALRLRLLAWWRTTTLDIGYLAAATLALSIPVFFASIISSPFTPSLKWLWTAVLLAVIGTITFVYGYWREQQAAVEAHLQQLATLARNAAIESPDDE